MRINPYGERRSQGTQEAFIEFLAKSDSKQNYVGIEAIRNSDIYTGVRIIATDIATSPITLTDDKGKSLLDNDLIHLLNYKPNNTMTAFHFKFALVANMILCGESFAYIKRENGMPISLELLKPSEISIYSNEDRIEYHVNIQRVDKDNKVILSKREVIPHDDILHFKYVTTDGLRGRSPLSSLQQELSMIDTGNRTMLSSLKRGVTGAGLLKVKRGTLNYETKQKIRNDWERINSTENNESGTIILDDSMDYTQLEVSTEVLKLVNSNTWQTKQIAKALGLPLDRFGMELINTSSEEANHNYVRASLAGYFVAFSSELNFKLLSTNNLYFGFNSEAITEPPRAKKQAMIVEAVDAGVISIDEARIALGYDPRNTAETDKLERKKTSKEVN